MITLPNGLLITAISLPVRAANENLLFALNLSPPRPHNGNLTIQLPSFYPYTPQLNQRVKAVPACRNRFISFTLGYKLPHRHCSSSIGQSLSCLLLPPVFPKTPTFLSSSKQMASNKHAGEGSPDAPPLLRPSLG